MIPEAALLLHFSMTDPSTVRVETRQRLATSPTGCSETPLPASMAPTSLLDPGTGDMLLSADIGTHVHGALRLAQALAVLPIDPAHEARIDRLVDARIRGVSAKRSLRSSP